MRPASAARRAAAASTNSSACEGTHVTRLTWPGACPERPARCKSRATPFGLPICSTRSTGEKSTPRSRLEVATTALSLPSFRPCSTQCRTSASSEPWCRPISPAHSGRASSNPWYQISACERTLVKTSVERAESIAAMTCSSMTSPMCPAQGNLSTSGGMSVSIRTFLSLTPLTMRRESPSPRGPSGAGLNAEGRGEGISRSSASSRFPNVADNPQVLTRAFHFRSRARHSSVITPRLLPSSSCHSSTTTRRRSESFSRASGWESSSERLSGVVTSADGKLRACRARSALEVSPVRSPTVHGNPRPLSARSIEITVSPASARMGVIQRTRRGGALFVAPSPRPRATSIRGELRPGPNFASSIHSASGPSHAASVLPLPVAECTRPDSPAR